jgi:hypothetical protein
LANKVAYLPAHAAHLLTVIEEAAVSEAVDAANAEYRFAEDIFEAAKWRLAHDRGAGTPLNGFNPPQRLICIPSNQIAKSPTLLVRFTASDTDVTITWVKFLPYDESSAVTPDAYHL